MSKIHPQNTENNVTDDVMLSSVQWQMAHDLKMMTMTNLTLQNGNIIYSD